MNAKVSSRRTISSNVDGLDLLCVNNVGHEASLERGKLYRRRRDAQAASLGLLRVVDESDEDYLYPSELFVSVSLSADIVRAMKRSQRVAVKKTVRVRLAAGSRKARS